MELRCGKILITGGSRGIGFAIANRLCQRGATVVITGRSEGKLNDALAKLPQDRAFGLVQNVQSCDEMEQIVLSAAKMMGGLDCLINNAGMTPGYQNEWGMGVLELTPELWDRVMNTNVRSVFFMMQAAAKYMIKHDVKGSILNISSEAAFVPATGSYGASKHAVRALTAGWANLLASKGILVNGIAPGTTETDLVDIDYENSLNRQKNNRLAKPEEIAALAEWMLSKENVNMMGQTILSCGGSTIL